MACTCTCLKCEDDGVTCEPYECECPCINGEDSTTYSSKALTRAREEKVAADARSKKIRRRVKKR